jgi:AcrR family transcriptional regulator
VVSAEATHRGQVRRQRKALLSDWRQQAILDAARRIFARLGYAATNIENIAKEAGIAKGTVYLYFKSKEELFAGVVARDLECLTTESIDAMARETTFEDRLTVFLKLRLAYLQHNQDFLRIFLAEFGSRGSRSPVISRIIDKQVRRGIDHMRQCVEDAVAHGELRPVPVEAAAHAILDLARGFAERHLRRWTRLSLVEDLAFTRSLILRGLQKP